MAQNNERRFKIEENQKMWDAYFNGSLEAWDKENRATLEATEWTDEQKTKESAKMTAYKMSLDKTTPYNIAFIRKKQSLQQYKPIVLQFEEYVGKSFNDITTKDIEEFSDVTEKQNKLNHLNAFLLYCVSNGILKNRDKEFLISLLPETYREIGKIIGGLE